MPCSLHRGRGPLETIRGLGGGWKGVGWGVGWGLGGGWLGGGGGMSEVQKKYLFQRKSCEKNHACQVDLKKIPTPA